MNVTETGQIFRAFADPTRLRILRLLKDGALCVGDLVAALRVPQPTASRHLRYLTRAGLVESCASGRWRYYGLVRATGLRRDLLRCLGNGASRAPEFRRDAARLKSLEGCCPP